MSRILVSVVFLFTLLYAGAAYERGRQDAMRGR